MNRNGRQVFSDDKAEELLAAQAQITVSNGIVRPEDIKANTQLRSAIQACANIGTCRTCGETIQLKRQQGSLPFKIDVVPYRTNQSSPSGDPATAMLLIRDPSLSRSADMKDLNARFGLTRAEAALAIEMMKGDGRAAAAERCGITVNTARTHLMRIFEKTGVKRQAELIRVLMNA